MAREDLCAPVLRQDRHLSRLSGGLFCLQKKK
jgi:hypothetical protein